MARVLVVEDERTVRQTLQSFLERDGHHVHTASNYEEAILKLSEQAADLVVTDVYLGKKTGLEVLNAVNEHLPGTPVIVITGQASIETASNCIRSGAFDFLQKPLDCSNFIDATRRAIKEGRRRKKAGVLIKQSRQFRKQLGKKVESQSFEIERATKELIKSEQRFRSLVDAVPEIILEFDLELRCIWYNDLAQKFYGEQIYNQSLAKLFSNDETGTHIYKTLADMPKLSDSFLQIKSQQLRKDKQLRKISWRIKPLIKGGGELYGYIATARDITEMARLEEQLRQRAKLESIGQLAGGLAHDFNNMLAAILAQANLIKRSADTNTRAHQSAASIEMGVLRAKELTDKLLDFAQCGKNKSCSFNVHSIIEELVALLGRTLNKKISIRTELIAEESIIYGDPNQIYQVLLNLVINARDAIKQKLEQSIDPNVDGQIVISTTLNKSHLLRSSLNSNSVIQITIEDNGCGIPKDVERHIFEPFFSTKREHGHSGMGLAMAYGIVNNHDGYITVNSDSKSYTAFTITLPVSEQPL